MIWLIVPPKADSLWKKIGPFGQGKRAELTPLKRETRPEADA